MADFYWTGYVSDDVENVNNYDLYDSEPYTNPPASVPGLGDTVYIASAWIYTPASGTSYADWSNANGDMDVYGGTFYGDVNMNNAVVYEGDFHGDAAFLYVLGGNFYGTWSGSSEVYSGNWYGDFGYAFTLIGEGLWYGSATCDDFSATVMEGGSITCSSVLAGAVYGTLTVGWHLGNYSTLTVHPTGSLILSSQVYDSNPPTSLTMNGRCKLMVGDWMYSPNSVWTAALTNVRSGTTNINGTGTLALPPEDKVEAGSQFGAAGTEFEGTLDIAADNPYSNSFYGKGSIYG